MREILFRGKTDDGKWVEGYFVPDCLESLKNRQVEWGFIRKYWIGEDKFTKHEVVEVERNTVGQFTGLTDKNGKKIFEGDIVQGTIVSAWNKRLIRCGIVYVKDGFCAIERYKDGTGYSHKVCFAKDIEVIGNIQDNPELLED